MAGHSCVRPQFRAAAVREPMGSSLGPYVQPRQYSIGHQVGCYVLGQLLGGYLWMAWSLAGYLCVSRDSQKSYWVKDACRRTPHPSKRHSTAQPTCPPTTVRPHRLGRISVRRQDCGAVDFRALGQALDCEGGSLPSLVPLRTGLCVDDMSWV